MRFYSSLNGKPSEIFGQRKYVIWFIYLKGISDHCETSPREARIEKEQLRKEGSDPDKRCPWPESGWCSKWYWDCTCILNIQKIRFADGLDMVWKRKREWRIISYIWPEQLMNGGVTDRGYGRGRANMMKIGIKNSTLDMFAWDDYYVKVEMLGG